MRFFIVGILTGIVISNPHNQHLFKTIASNSKKYFKDFDLGDSPSYEDDVVYGEVINHEGEE